MPGKTRFFIVTIPLAIVMLLASDRPCGRAAEPAPTNSGAAAPDAADVAWPALTRQTRPWTYWWWMGSAVDRVNLTDNLEMLHSAGIGGVHVIPIYGVHGYESHFIPFLSSSWMAMLEHAAREARRLGMGLDMSTGTGWPFGGPQVTDSDAAQRVRLVTMPADPSQWQKPLDRHTLRALVAYDSNDSAHTIDVTRQVTEDGKLQWTPPPGDWRLVALLAEPTGQRVKRAAPGGDGWVVNPYSDNALRRYLEPFRKAFARAALPVGLVRAQYHDSFEYYQAGWSDDVFTCFRDARGYDLRQQLPALAGTGSSDQVRRVRTDYCESLSDLHLNFVTQWNSWAHSIGCITRDQAHGAPGNLLDLYAAADIPETEIFGNEGGNPLMSKFASSAAHVSGKPRASSETCTWLGEHFCVALADCKAPIDRLFASGINHIFYHGIAYSPRAAAWPGWLFYAATNFGPSNSFWRDFPALNLYVARCQAILQSGRPDNDVLLYWPIHDLWHHANRLVRQLTVHEPWLDRTSCGQVAKRLWERGYGFDYVSDRQLRTASFRDQRVRTIGAAYRVVVLPDVARIPVTTMAHVIQLARAGGTVIVVGRMPADVPGWGHLSARRAELGKLLQQLGAQRELTGEVAEQRVGSGRFLVGPDLQKMLALAGVARESIVDHGIVMIRRAHAEGHIYFLSNQGSTRVDQWITLGVPFESAVIMDPMSGRAGVARCQTGSAKSSRVRLQLNAGQSCVVKTFAGRQAKGPAWRYLDATGPSKEVTGEWKVEFISGGPSLPSPYKTTKLDSWTSRDDPAARRFAGTARYAIQMDLPDTHADDWLLDLGEVDASARVRINGHEAGTLFARPFQIAIGQWLHAGANRLEVEATNLSANRIADLDRRGVAWRKFYDINYVNIKYKPFDASKWPLHPAGLLGPVRLVPLVELRAR